MTLEGLPLNRRWNSVPARRVLLERQDAVREEDEIVTCFRDGQVTLRRNRREEGFTNAIQEHGYKSVEPGDLVVHSMDAFAGAIGVSDSRGKMSPVVGIYQAPIGDARFYAYYLRACAYSGYIESLAKGIRERSTSFDRQSLAGLHLPDVPVEEQRRIADFLDDQVTRIDEALESISDEAVLLRHRLESSVEAAFSTATMGATVRTLGNLAVTGWVEIGRGNVISKETIDDVPGEYPVYSSARENEGEIGRYGRYMFDEEMVTWSVDGGGDVFYRPPHRFSVTNICAYARVRNTANLETNYLALAMQRARSRVNFDWQDKAHPGVVRGIYRIPIPTLGVQRGLVRQTEELTMATESIVTQSRRLADLLEERKRSLITAAVTGDMDVTTARPIGAGASA